MVGLVVSARRGARDCGFPVRGACQSGPAGTSRHSRRIPLTGLPGTEPGPVRPVPPRGLGRGGGPPGRVRSALYNPPLPPMTPPAPAEIIPTVSLRLDGDEVSADAFLEAARSLLDLLSEVGRSLSEQRAIAWRISDLSTGSANLALQPTPATDRAHAGRTISSTVGGLAEMDADGTRPPHFSDKALRSATKLGRLAGRDGTHVALRAAGGPGGERLQVLSGRVEVHGRQMLRRPSPREYGSVEGTLEALTIHGQDAFSVYDAITGKRIECVCDRETLERATEHLGKRVLVSGEIRHPGDGESKKVIVESFQLLGVGPLPQAEDVRGMFADDPVDIEEWSRYVREE